MLDLRGADADVAAGPVDAFIIQDELQSLVRLLEPTAIVRGVLLRLSGTVESLQLQLPLDEFRQILFNILTNAIEASQAGDEVQMSVVELPTGAIELRIRDVGHGIPDAARPRLFEPFFSTRTQRDGSDHGVRGMGLAICRNLAERLGLTIDYSTQEGVGTEFRVGIPAGRRAS
jgi:signal transduction histidine kinase